MRDLFKLFDRRYSAVNISESNPPSNVDDNLQYLQQIDFNHRHRKKSLQASRSLKQGFTIVDSFFSQRKGGKRYPKCKLHFYYFDIFIKLNMYLDMLRYIFDEK